MFNGLDIRFSDWRFIHRARLNVVPTNQNKARWDDLSSAACRRCGHDKETLPHIIDHCPSHMVDIRSRHDKVVGRLLNAVRVGNAHVDSQVPGVKRNF